MKGPIMLCHNHHPGGIFVQSMDNPGAPLPSDSLKIRTEMEQGIHKGSALPTGSRMNHHAGGLIHYQAVLIFEENIQRDRLRHQRRLPWRQQPDLDRSEEHTSE